MRPPAFSSAANSNTPPQARLPFAGLVDTIARGLDDRMPSKTLNVRGGNFSVEDWTFRLMPWTITIPQNIYAIYYRQHPWETCMRNLITWSWNSALVYMERSPKGLKAWLNPLMRPRRKLAPLPYGSGIGMRIGYRVENFINNLRPELNYLEVAKKAGIRLETLGVKSSNLEEVARKEAIWSKLKILTQIRTIGLYSRQLSEKARAMRPGSAQQDLMKEAFQVNRLLRRISLFHYAGFMGAAGLMGISTIFLHRLVFKYIAPLDQKYTPLTHVNLSLDRFTSPKSAPNGRKPT